MNTDASPSELVLAHALRNPFAEFPLNWSPTHSLQKILARHLDLENRPRIQLAS